MPVAQQQPPLRGTQLLVEHIATVLRRPGLVAIEVGWRWLFGIPFLFVCAGQLHTILAGFPLESSGLTSIDAQNPWVAAQQLAGAIAYYGPHVAAVLRWLLPSGALVWVLISGAGRAFLLHRMGTGNAHRMPFRLFTVILLQAVWLLLLALAFWGWLRSMQWVAATHITVAGEPDLVGYAMWTIFLALGFFTVWALVSWTVSVAPLLALLENRSAVSALAQSLHLGKAFSGKLAEINLVLGIVKLALVVVAMVFAAAPLPFSDELGPQAMHFVWAASVGFFLIADDVFQVVRLKAFAVFWQAYRGQGTARSITG